MSLIFGICLPRKIYLVSDSRLTTLHEDGSRTFSDDFGKWVDINPRLGVVTANSAYQASWILRKIIPEIKKRGMVWDFTDLNHYLKENLKEVAKNFYSETHRLEESASFIFGGFEKTKKLQIEAARLGEAMSAPVVAAGEGNPVEQSVDMDIINAFSLVLNRAAAEGREVPGDTLFDVNLPKPRVLAVTVRATNKGVKVKYEDAMCYDGLVLNPNFKTERIKLPGDLIGQLEYRDKSSETDQTTIYEDYKHIILYVDRLIDEKQWHTVGGEILPLLILPDSSGVATGNYVRVKNGERYIGGIGTNDKGEVHYYDKQGKMIPFRFIYNYLDEKIQDSSARI